MKHRFSLGNFHISRYNKEVMKSYLLDLDLGWIWWLNYKMKNYTSWYSALQISSVFESFIVVDWIKHFPIAVFILCELWINIFFYCGIFSYCRLVWTFYPQYATHLNLKKSRLKLILLPQILQMWDPIIQRILKNYFLQWWLIPTHLQDNLHL